MAQFLVVAFVGILATMFILKARRYQAEVNQKIEISERAIQERDISLTNFQSEGASKDKEIESLKQSLDQVTGERDILMHSEDGLTEELALADIKVVELENQVSQDSISRANQIQQLQDELKNAQDELAATQAQPKGAEEKLAAVPEHSAAAVDAPAEGAADADAAAEGTVDVDAAAEGAAGDAADIAAEVAAADEDTAGVDVVAADTDGSDTAGADAAAAEVVDVAAAEDTDASDYDAADAAAKDAASENAAAAEAGLAEGADALDA